MHVILLWPHYVIGQAIIFLPCGFFLLFSLAQSQRSENGCLPYFHTWCGLSANLRCRFETCCTRLAENRGRKKCRQKSPSGHHRTTLSGYIFATKARIDSTIGKKLVKQQYVLQMSPQYRELRPTNGWDQFGSSGHHAANFNARFASWQSYCTAVK